MVCTVHFPIMVEALVLLEKPRDPILLQAAANCLQAKGSMLPARLMNRAWAKHLLRPRRLHTMQCMGILIAMLCSPCQCVVAAAAQCHAATRTCTGASCKQAWQDVACSLALHAVQTWHQATRNRAYMICSLHASVLRVPAWPVRAVQR